MDDDDDAPFGLGNRWFERFHFNTGRANRYMYTSPVARVFLLIFWFFIIACLVMDL
jgi:hypothetical protein